MELTLVSRIIFVMIAIYAATQLLLLVIGAIWPLLLALLVIGISVGVLYLKLMG